MKFQFFYPAGENNIFAKDAFKSSIGKPFNLKAEDKVIDGEAILVDAKVSKDGVSVLFTVDTKKLTVEMFGLNFQHKSIEFEIGD